MNGTEAVYVVVKFPRIFEHIKETVVPAFTEQGLTVAKSYPRQAPFDHGMFVFFNNEKGLCEEEVAEFLEAQQVFWYDVVDAIPDKLD